MEVENMHIGLVEAKEQCRPTMICGTRRKEKITFYIVLKRVLQPLQRTEIN